MILPLDFETRSELELKECGAWKYSLHPSTTVLCTAWAWDDKEVQCQRHIPERLKELGDDVTVSAFNAGFEYAIWHNVLVARFGFPELPIERWRCSSAVALMHSLPRDLAGVANALDLPCKKDEAGKRVMLKMCKPVPENRQHLHGKWYESEEDYQILEEYCIDDVKVERELTKRLGFLPPDEQELWELDKKINFRGVRIDVPLAHGIVAAKQKVCDHISGEFEDKMSFRPSQIEKIKQFLRDSDVEIPTKKAYKKDSITGEREAHMVESLGAKQIASLLVQDIPEECKWALRQRQEFATTSLAKATAGVRHEVDGIVHNQFIYHGANTGRWAGVGIQLQNMPRGEFDEDWIDDEMYMAAQLVTNGAAPSQLQEAFNGKVSPMRVLKSCLRGMIIPRKGMELTVMDFSQIEARVIAWLAGQQDVLDAFASGQDLYKFTAAQIYEKNYEDISKDERFIGKTASLALGYQGGAGAFINMANNFGVGVEKELAENIKADWRSRNAKIVKLWWNLQKAAIRAVQAGKTTQVGPIKFAVRDGFLLCKLPSGRCLRYYQPSVKVKDGRPQLSHLGSDQQRGIKWGRISTYGGKLAENVTQAVSRDLLALSMIRLDKAGYDIVGHVHDEVIIEGVESDPDVIKETMLQLPSWAYGLPVEADGFKGERYRK